MLMYVNSSIHILMYFNVMYFNVFICIILLYRFTLSYLIVLKSTNYTCSLNLLTLSCPWMLCKAHRTHEFVVNLFLHILDFNSKGSYQIASIFDL